jgi:hypothetical protein
MFRLFITAAVLACVPGFALLGVLAWEEVRLALRTIWGRP